MITKSIALSGWSKGLSTSKELQTLEGLAYRLEDRHLVHRTTTVLSLDQSKNVYLTMELINAERSNVHT